MWLDKYLKEKITLWTPTGADRWTHRSFGDPKIILGKWEDRVQEYTTTTGENLYSRAIILTKDHVQVGDWLYRGCIAPEEGPPTIEMGALPVQRVERVDDLKYRIAMYRVML